MPENRLDEHIKNQLAHYEAAFDPGAWDQMEATLDAADWDGQIREKLAMYAAPYEAAAWQEMASHLDSPFDTYVRKKLERFSTQFNPADWARMAMLLDDSLEASIRARLESHEAPFRPATDWPIMVGALDATFDEAVKEKLDQLAPEAEMEADWSRMVVGIAPPFDQSIHEKLAGYEAAYHPMEWLQMEAQLDVAKDDDGIWWYARWQTYALAASFVLIAMLSIGGINLLSERLWQSENMTGRVIFPQKRAMQPLQAETSSAQSSQIQDPGKEADPAEKANAVLTGEQLHGADTARALAQAQDPVESGNRIDPIDSRASLAHSHIGMPVQAIATAETVAFDPDEIDPDSESVGEPDKLRQAPGRKTRKDIALTSIASPAHPITLGFYESDLHGLLGGHVPNMDARVNLRNPEIRLGMYLASTNSVAELNDASQPGFGAGLRAEVRFDDEWSIVSGMLFTQKQFSHKYYIFADDRTQWENVIDANFKALEVPVLVKYRFPASGKIQLYAQAGLATMVTLEERYLRYNPLSFENTDRVSRSVDKNQHIPTSQKLTLNTYVGNVQAAAGLEYEVSDRLSLQLEPYFQWGLQPMGTEQKSLHSLGVGTALVYKFGNKSS